MAKQTTRDAQLDAYYRTLDEFAQQDARHEGAVSVAFQSLLADTARRHHWTLIPQLGAEGIRPDGTLKDPMGLVRGHWEAKDTADVLDAEIARKIKKGYPLGNIIFEDTRNAVLYQNKAEIMRVDLRDREQLARLLDAFFAYVEPQIATFEKAVDEFKERVPDIARHLKEKITDAHATNRKFKDAFASFLEVCRTALNPNINQDAVDDMLVQHLLTERLIREIFDNPEFTRRNVIAVEIETVIEALTSRSFDRNAFLKSLDRFYVAIENAARTITEWSDKQHFLNTVYERFFQGYSVKLADTMGIVYTPQPIVDFMCASVVEVLKTEFGKTLGDPDVNILDPCTGTGNFIVNLLRRVPKKDLKRVYAQQLFANEVMLMPYYIAVLNIEHAYYEQTGEYEPFEGLCFVDTLDLAESRQGELSFMTEKNTERVERQKRTPITVIIGNPPYNFGQANENDNNKNRRYPVIDERVRETYSRDSKATLKNSLFDPFVKFFRWATDRLGNRDGIVCLVTNNAFVENLSFDGMRRHLLNDFELVYHFDCRGNVRQNPKLTGTAYNVFGIQVGVGITVAVRKADLAGRPASARNGGGLAAGLKKSPRPSGTDGEPPPLMGSSSVRDGPIIQSTERVGRLRFHRLPMELRRHAKLKQLGTLGSIGGVEWQLLTPDAAATWITTGHGEEFAGYTAIGGKEGKATAGTVEGVVFQFYCGGINTNRDNVVYDFDTNRLRDRIRRFIDDYNYEVYRYAKESANGVIDVDEFVNYEKIKWDGTLKGHLARQREVTYKNVRLRHALYRPFTKSFIYFDSKLINSIYLFDHFFPTPETEGENRLIWVKVGTDWPMFGLIANHICDLLPQGGSQCFPFYVYDEDGTNRRENITDWALDQFRSHYNDPTIGKWDIFHYVYGVLHHPGYRETFADNLKRELPRIPFAPDFPAFAQAGRALAGLHLDYEELEPWPLDWIETPGVPLSYRVEKMKLSKDKTTLVVNPSLTLGGIPPETAEYRLGNRSALEWVIDQYQVSTDKRSGIKSDPNREDDEEYIVRLVGQVVRVSVETVKIVKALPEAFAGGPGGSQPMPQDDGTS